MRTTPATDKKKKKKKNKKTKKQKKNIQPHNFQIIVSARSGMDPPDKVQFLRSSAGGAIESSVEEIPEAS